MELFLRAHWIARAKRRGRGTAAAAVGVLLLAPVLATAPAAASPDGEDVVINEIYTRGGSANQPFTHKFVELYNPTDAAIDLDGWSLQYRSKSNTGTGKVDLAGAIPAGGFYLVQGGSNADNGEPLAEPDAAGGRLDPAEV